jgi:hypothetical protein
MNDIAIKNKSKEAYARMKADPARWAKYQAMMRRKSCRQPGRRAAKYIENLPRRLYAEARRRAKKRGLGFDITVEDVDIPTHCPILGLRLEVATGQKTGAAYSPSLDRIHNEYGYIKGNVQVISYRANTLKNNATAEELRKIADWMDENQF